MPLAPLPAFRRALVAWLLLGAVVIPLAGGLTLPASWTALLAAGWALLVGAAGRGGLLLAAARRGALSPSAEPGPEARSWRLARQLSLGLILGGAGALGGAAWALGMGAVGAPAILVTLAVPVAGGLAIVAAAAGRPPDDLRARSSTPLRLAVDTAVPVALLAGPFGALLLACRVAGRGLLDENAVVQHLIVSSFLYALLLGLAGALKTYTERSSGLVSTEVPERWVPGPLLLAAGVAIAVWSLPREVFSDLDLVALLTLKAVFSTTVALGASGLGALRGLRTAERLASRR